MKISVVIPVYNTEKYIEQSIESALNQTYDNVEVIIINDGSTDSTNEILTKFQDKVRIFHKENGGTASALNLGIQKMTGEWFKWLSADDILKKDAIEKLVQEINQLGEDAKQCIIYSNYDIIDENGKIINTFVEPNYNSLDKFQRNVILLDSFYGNGTTSIIHKSVFEKCGVFDETLEYKDDYEFWLRCCLLYNYKLHLLPKNLAQYRIHPNQLTNTRYTDTMQTIKKIRSVILQKLSPALKQKYLQSLHNYQKQKPLKIRLRSKVRGVMFSILPKTTSDKILQMYMSRKSTKN